MKKAVVLGGGMIGRVVAQDLAQFGESFSVTVFDRSPKAVQEVGAISGVRAEQADLSQQSELRRAIQDADVVVGTLASHLAYAALRTIIEAGKPCVDVAFMAEDATELDAMARERGLSVVVDCGVAPGVSNALCGYELGRFERLDALRILVGGLPLLRRWPYEYKAPFAPADVLEEYTRPARYVQNGKVVVREALSEPELVDFDVLGTLEAFNTDGLRSLLNLPVPNMIEKTMRYPGHIELMRVLRHTGFFSKDSVRLPSGVELSPLELTQHLLFPLWHFEPGEQDITVMRVEAEGVLDGQAQRVQHDLVDHYDPRLGQTSMGRSTAFPAAIVARWLLDESLARPGVHPPEKLAKDSDFWPRLRDELAKRNVKIIESRHPVA